MRIAVLLACAIGGAMTNSGGAGPLDRPLTSRDLKAMKTLGLDNEGGNNNISAKDIKEKFRSLVKKYHPDRNQNDPKAAILLREAIEAYNHLAKAISENR